MSDASASPVQRGTVDKLLRTSLEGPCFEQFEIEVLRPGEDRLALAPPGAVSCHEVRWTLWRGARPAGPLASACVRCVPRSSENNLFSRRVDIAAVADVSLATVSDYFPMKKDLVFQGWKNTRGNSSRVSESDRPAPICSTRSANLPLRPVVRSPKRRPRRWRARAHPGIIAAASRCRRVSSSSPIGWVEDLAENIAVSEPGAVRARVLAASIAGLVQADGSGDPPRGGLPEGEDALSVIERRLAVN